MAHYPAGHIRPKKPQPTNGWPADKRWVVGYVRVSDNPQAEPDRASLGEQEQGIQRRCQEKGYFLIRIFSDVGRRWMPPVRTSRKWSVLSEKIFEPVI